MQGYDISILYSIDIYLEGGKFDKIEGSGLLQEIYSNSKDQEDEPGYKGSKG